MSIVINYVRLRNTKYEVVESYLWIWSDWDAEDWKDLETAIRQFMKCYEAGAPKACAYRALPEPLEWVNVIGFPAAKPKLNGHVVMPVNHAFQTRSTSYRRGAWG